jgi:predicted phage terminase large subunit-like protein
VAQRVGSKLSKSAWEAAASVEGMALTVASRQLDVFLKLAFQALQPGEQLSWAWHLDALCAELTRVFTGDCRRLVVTKPPRYLKSIVTSVVFPAYILGRDPTRKIICVSYGQDLADEHARLFRRLIESDTFRRVFPNCRFARVTNEDTVTTAGGRRFSTTVKGTVTGFGADYIIMDDVMKAQEARSPEVREQVKSFYDQTLVSRLNDKETGRIVCVAQRLHEDDIVGHLLTKGTFQHLSFPAIAEKDETITLMRGREHRRRIGDVLNPEREGRGRLEELRKEMGARNFAQQYQQDPAAPDSAYIAWDRIHFYDEPPPRDRLLRVVMSWDTAAVTSVNADYSVGTVWGFDGSAWLLLDVIRGRWEYTDLLSRVRLERRKWQPDLILVEHASTGIALLSDLRKDHVGRGPVEHRDFNSRPIRWNCIMPKEERIFTHLERLYEGVAKFPRMAPFLDDLRREIMGFPDCRHDDQVDSVSMFLDFAGSRPGHAHTRNERPSGRKRPRPPGYRQRNLSSAR